ncbi:MAG: hypothetical protein QOI40_5606 [Alphaproteobacteria bacterium]|jgi:hypothetical protein|nr:hypothetical protein [Alphaproteobacteria bacterium]
MPGIRRLSISAGELNAEQHFEYFRPVRPGEVLTAKTTGTICGLMMVLRPRIPPTGTTPSDDGFVRGARLTTKKARGITLAL